MNQLTTLKSDVNAEELLKLEGVKDKFDEELDTIVGHCRFPTKGDPEHNENNHPFEYKNTIIVHQGIIWNDAELKEQYGFVPEGDTDSWIIVHLIEYYREQGFSMIQAIAKTHEELKGSWAVVAIDKLNPNNLYIFCHNKEVKVCYLPDDDLFFFSTDAKKLDAELIESVEHFGIFKEVIVPRIAELNLADEDCLCLGDEVELYELPEPETKKWNWNKDKGRTNKKIINKSEFPLVVLPKDKPPTPTKMEI